MRRTISLIIAFLALATPSRAQSADVLADIMKAVDGIRDIADSSDPPVERIERAARAGCNALSRLLENTQFLPSLEAAFAKGDRKAAEAVRQDLAVFANEFARWEQDQLRRAGASPESVAILMTLVGAFRNAQQPKEFSAAMIYLRIKNLRDELCKVAKDIETTQLKQVTQQTRRDWYFKIAGVAIAAADVAAAPATSGFVLLSLFIGQVVADGVPRTQ